MKYLFFDTETTGPNPSNARIVQLAWLLASEAGETLIERSYIIRPEGFVIPAENSKIHGITHLKAIEDGTRFDDVIYRFNNSLFQAEKLVAHNFLYDFTVMSHEFEIRGMAANAAELGKKMSICTMQLSTDFCQIPNPRGAARRGIGRWKLPNLTELHYHLFGKPFDNAHDALADVQACARCFFELKQINAL